MNKTMTVAITGRIGAGKSAVANIFKDLGVPIYEIDATCKRLVSESVRLRSEIINVFGIKSFFVNGDYNTKYILSIIQNDIEKKKELEAIMTKHIIPDFANWKDSFKLYPIIMLESAYLFETGSENMADVIIGVDCNLTENIERIKKRDNCSTTQALKKIEMQMPQKDKMSLCDFVIHTDRNDINEQVIHFFELLTRISTYQNSI